MPILSAQTTVGLAKEAVYGTAVAPTTFLSVESPAPVNKQTWAEDKGFRGAPSAVYGAWPLIKSSEYGFKSMVYPVQIGHLLMAMFGATAGVGSSPGASTTLSTGPTAGAQTISTAATIAASTIIQIDTSASGISEIRTVQSVSGAGPFTLTLNAPINFGHASGATVVPVSAPFTYTQTLANGQPPSYTLTDYDAINTRQYAGSVLESLEFDFAANAALTVNAKWQGLFETTTSLPVASYEQTNPFLNWQGTAAFGGTNNTNIAAGTITLKRASIEQIVTLANTQAPKVQFVGPIDASGKLTVIVQDDTEFNYFKNGVIQSLVITLAQPGSGPSIKFQMSKCYMKEASRKRGKNYLEVDLTFAAYANTTDAATNGPAAPGQVVLVNSSATAY